ncbi:hypothetical protein NKH71_03110 [Mesorhizobium sp. M0983]|uniref:hypothetical protein n=1 Tax=Mesorhizobium sp. M0983 TaxID=2957040 RepID=UPI00333794E0
MDARITDTETLRSAIPHSLAGRGERPSPQTRPVYPETETTRHPRAIELADAIREIAGGGLGATEKDISMLGFSVGEIIEHLPMAKIIIAESFVREIQPAGDRVPQIIEKALLSAAHIMPKTAGLDPASEDAAEKLWRTYCSARAAFKLDPWWSQSERCLALLKSFLRKLPLIDREVNRILYAVAAAQKADVSRSERA